MSHVGHDDPFAALGLPARAGLTDDDVRAAWRRLAAATHPDRADGGDPDRFARAAAAYTALRTTSGRGEALADRAGPGARPPGVRWPGHLGRAADTRPADASLADAPQADVTGAGVTAEVGGPAAVDGTAPLPVLQPGRARGSYSLVSRIRRGRPGRLAVRLLIAAAVTGVAGAVAGWHPATPALAVGALTWLLCTARNDLAPPS